jgi:hypothetical protein
MKDEKVKFRISFLLFPKQKLLYNTAETDFHKELKPEATSSLKPLGHLKPNCPGIII